MTNKSRNTDGTEGSVPKQKGEPYCLNCWEAHGRAVHVHALNDRMVCPSCKMTSDEKIMKIRRKLRSKIPNKSSCDPIDSV
jgi:hypothetical protein